MIISAEASPVVLLVGLIAGWLTAQILQRASFGLFGDLVVGVSGAILGRWALPQLGVSPGEGFAGTITKATIGATSLLSIMELGSAFDHGTWSWRQRPNRNWLGF